jgi:hypothetical protein
MRRDIGMVALGYGKYVRTTDIVALIPIEDGERGEGRRTYVYVAGLDAPIVASRSEKAILADMEHAPGLAPASPGAPSGDPLPGVTASGRSRGARRWRRPGASPAGARRRTSRSA